MAKKGAFGIIEIGATPDVVGQLRNWRQMNEPQEIDVTVMGTGDATIIPGSISRGVECDLFWKYGDTGQAYILANLGSDTTHPVALYPEGKGSGLPVWNGDCYIMGANPEAAADGAIEMNGVQFPALGGSGAWSAQV